MKKIIFQTLFFASFFGCTEPKKPLTTTRLFEEGLVKSFRTHIPKDPHVFVVIKSACTQCRVSTALFFDSILSQNSNEPVTVLVGTKYDLSQKFLNNPRVIVNDTTKDFFDLKFLGHYPISLISTKDATIETIFNFDIRSIDSLPVIYAKLKQRAGP